jgi:hypothetical protein
MQNVDLNMSFSTYENCILFGKDFVSVSYVNKIENGHISDPRIFNSSDIQCSLSNIE